MEQTEVHSTAMVIDRETDRANALGRLRQAIIDNTSGDLFWIGETLLDELEGKGPMRADKLTDAARAAAVWFIKFCDYGDESVNYQNGDSDVFAGIANKDAEAIKRDLQAALATKGISVKDLVSLANNPPHTRKRR